MKISTDKIIKNLIPVTIILLIVCIVVVLKSPGGDNENHSPADAVTPECTDIFEPSAEPAVSPTDDGNEGTPSPSPTAAPTPSDTPAPTGKSEIGPKPDKTTSEIYTHGNTSAKKIALSINVAWGEENLADILKILSDNNIKASFMIQGYWANYYQNDCPQYLRSIYEGGHELGIHGWGRDDATTLSDETLARVLKKAHDEIQNDVGYDCWVYTPFSGYVNENVAEIAASGGFTTVTWNVDSKDWMAREGLIEDSDVYRNVIDGLSGGAIILFHPTEALVHILPELIAEATRRGYTFTTVSDCIFG